MQIGKTGRTPLRFPLRPPRSPACGEPAPLLPDSAKEVAWAAYKECISIHVVHNVSWVGRYDAAAGLRR